MIPLEAMWPLTRAWYGGRLDPDYRPASIEHLQGLLRAAGASGPFWSLT
jgi:hypothetical protein